MENRQIQSMSQHYFGIPPKFDPEKGQTIFEPEGEGYGYWVGGHSVVFDPEADGSHEIRMNKEIIHD